MNSGDAAPVRRRAVALATTAALSLWPAFASTPVGHAEPYWDDGEGSSYSEGGGSYGGADEGTEQGTQEATGDTGYGGTEQGDGTEQGAGAEGTQQGAGAEGTQHGAGAEGTQHGGQPTGESGYGGGAEGTDPAGDYEGGSGIIQPAELEADPSDVAAATSSGAVEVSSTETTREEISSYLESIESTSANTVRDAKTLNSPVSQWNSQWIRYDRNYRPVFVNPYFSPMQVVYQYGGKTQGFTVAPQQTAVLNVPDPGVYSFTAFTRPASGPVSNIPVSNIPVSNIPVSNISVSNVSVGSFSGGGYLPAAGQAPPQKPAAVPTVRNPIVQVQFTQGVSEPFRLGTLVDLGKDPSVKGATKVLLDGEVPAWGEWSKSEAGEPQFNITKTQLLPGLKPPGQDPLPGYPVELTAASHAMPWYMGTRTHVIGASVAAGVLALAAIALVLVRQRRVEE